MFKLVKNMGVDSVLEEATFLTHGIILKKELPPIEVKRYGACFLFLFSIRMYKFFVVNFSRCLHDERSKNRYAGIIRQYVAISGLNIEVFNQLLDGLGKIHRFFKDSLPNKRLQPMIPLVIEDNVAMVCHTRYFHPTRYCRSATALLFGPGVDPKGYLEQLQGTSYIHTKDNVVQYLGKKSDEGGTR